MLAIRYKTLDFTTDKRSWPWLHSGQTQLEQIAFRESLRQSELDAVLHYNFSQPKYHVVFNNDKRNKFGHHRAYRYLNNQTKVHRLALCGLLYYTLPSVNQLTLCKPIYYKPPSVNQLTLYRSLLLHRYLSEPIDSR